MSGDIFKIKIISTKTCFLYMPEKWIRKIQETNKTKGTFVRMLYGQDSTAYLSCVPFPTKDTEKNVASVNASFARTLNVSDGDDVVVSPLDNVPSVSSVHITPVSNDDFEILVESTGAVESSLLDQVRVVWNGQVLPIWISKTFCLEVRVDGLEPNSNFGCLEQFTELIVNSPSSGRNETQSYKANHFNKTSTTLAEFTEPAIPSTEQLLSSLPKPIQLPNEKNSSSENLLNKWLSSGKKIINAALGTDNLENNSAKSSADNICQSSDVFDSVPNSFRVHPLDVEDADLLLPCHVVVHKDLFSKVTQSSFTNPVVCKIARLIPPKVLVEYKSEEGSKVHVEETQFLKDQLTSDEKTRTMFAHLIAADEMDDRFKTVMSEQKMDCVFLSNSIRRQLCLEIGARAKLFLNQGNLLIKNVKTIEITPLVKNSKDLQYAVNTSFKNLVHQSKHGLVLSSNSHLIVPNSPSVGGSQETVVNITLNSSEQGYAIIKREQLEACKIIINNGRSMENDVRSLSHLDNSSSTENIFSLKFVNNLLSDARHSINLTLGLHSEATTCQVQTTFIQDNVLILGKAGCGKTSYVKLLCSQLQKSPSFVWTKRIDCKPLKGKKSDIIIRNLKQIFDEAVYHQPSLIILDDIEAIAGVEAEKDQHLMQDSTFKRVGRVIREIGENLQSRHAIAIVATVVSASQVNPELVSARGNHLFKTILEIPELTRSDRKELLQNALSCKEGVTLGEHLNLDNFASKTEGYTCQDLMDFIDKAVFVSWKIGRGIMSCINEDVLTEALAMSTPLSLRGVELHHETRHGWEEIGGLTTVKEELLEILQWPSMYPELFDQCPLRLQSGVLLYGAPGTGKTLLAGAVAHECGINFISIKGPELLSKYIGASEESVRKVFEKAMSAKPCVLFFDEFDSLAPRRGHDSTGVTDRVVNQLLTQLDGVEGLNGVWVLAATSRPDLLDPALLRPGRLDRMIYCPLPDEDDRLSIFHALSRHMKLKSDVDFEELAKKTNGFTGADLQAVLYTSQLAALEEREKYLQDSKDGGGGSSKVTKAVHKEKPLLEITNSNILQSLSSTRPSLPPSEYGRYQRIYDRFAATRGIPTTDMLKTQQKATLA